MIAIDTKPVSCDVLVAGGGIAGLMAAIAAADGGAKVVIAEKANAKRSGSGATGNDHFRCYIPEVHGEDMDRVLKAQGSQTEGGGHLDRDLSVLFMRESFLRVKDWDSWGIPMRPSGQWDFSGHAIPGLPKHHLKYAGEHQKLVLTTQALKRGVTILNKIPITEVITNSRGEVIGAIGISVAGEAPEMKVFRAKNVVLATGNTSRLYPPRTPGWIFNTANCPACTGGGRMAAYKAGATLVNLDMPYTHAGPKYFARCGKGTWTGVLKALSGKPVAPFAAKANRDGDVAADIWKGVFGAQLKAGQVVYMDCSEAPEEVLQYMLWGLRQEGDTSLLESMAADGIDVHTHMIEFQEYEPILFGRGIQINERSETSVPGLYAAGDEAGNAGGGIARACVFGHIAGRNAAARAAKRNGFENAEDRPLVAGKRAFYSEMLERESGASWMEANVAVQCLMNDYAGIEVRSEVLFKTGLEYMARLKQKACSSLKCSNSHELMRCLEALDLIELGELLMLAANERKETRGKHARIDYPYTNLLYDNKFITVRKVDGKPVIEWRDRT